jgi:hypothetical protein
MGEDYIKNEFNVPAANARREGSILFELVRNKVAEKANAILVMSN